MCATSTLNASPSSLAPPQKLALENHMDTTLPPSHATSAPKLSDEDEGAGQDKDNGKGKGEDNGADDEWPDGA